MNKKKLLSIGLVTACVLSVGTAMAFTSKLGKTYASTDGHLDCSYMELNYTSLADVLSICYEDRPTTIEKTWGTVTAIYDQSNYYHAYLQSTVNGKTGAVCLYKAKATGSGYPFSIGDVVYMSGKPTDYNGLLEFDCSAGCTYQVANDVVGYDVDIYRPNKFELTATPNNNADQWHENLLHGPIKSMLTNVRLNGNPASNKVTVTGADYSVELFWGNIGEASAINSKLSNAYNNGKVVDVVGYLNTYTKYPAKMQVFIRSANDLTVKDPVTILPTSITIDENESEYIEGKSYNMTASFLPLDCTNKDIVWSSSNEDVGYMSGDTFVAVSTGTTTITAKSAVEGVYDTLDVTVVPNTQTISSLSFTDCQGNIDKIDNNEYSVELTPYPTDECSTIFRLDYDYSCPTTFTFTVTSEETGGLVDSDYVSVGSWEGVEDHYEVIGYETGSYLVTIEETRSGITILLHVNVVEGGSTTTLKGIYFNCYTLYLDAGDEGEVVVYTNPIDANINVLSAQSFDESVCYVEAFDYVVYVVGLENGTATVEVDADGVKGYFTVVVDGGTPVVPTETTIDFSKISGPGSYATNFGRKTIDDIKYGYYRAGSGSGSWKLYPSANLVSADASSLPGAFYNDTAEYQIESLDITYKGTGVVKYGDSKTDLDSASLAAQSDFTTVNIDVDDTYYWYVEATTSMLEIKKIVANYTEDGTVFDGSYVAGNRVNTRIPATTYNGELVDGVSYVDVPTAVSISGNKYTVTSTKRYTYYSYSYVNSHSGTLDLDAIALTDPVDVANYYIAFKCAPANYGSKNDISAIANGDIGSISNVCSLFGDNARCLQQFNRTDGYAVGLPYVKASGKNYPVYLEFDFASNDNYSTDSRDVSRVVIWTDGWTNTNGDPVATMTDDHYVTFHEYNGYGGWNLPFDSKENGNYTQYRTGYFYGSTTTLVKA